MTGPRFRATRIILLVSACLLLALISRRTDLSHSSARVAAANAKTGGMPGVCTSHDYADGTSAVIRLFQTDDGENTDWFLFLPSGIRKEGLWWMTGDAERLVVGGSDIQAGDPFALADGAYGLEMRLDETERTGTLHVLTSASADSLFIRTGKENMEWLHADKTHTDTGLLLMLSSGGELVYSGGIGRIRCRGEASFRETDKKSYLIKLSGKADLVGGGKAKSYILVSNYLDASYIKNATAQHMVREMKVPYALKDTYADVYLNGVYAGNYFFTEKIEIGENRLAIRNLETENRKCNGTDDLTTFETFSTGGYGLKNIKGYELPASPADVSGGYVLELDMRERYMDGESAFITMRNQAGMIACPEEASRSEAIYIAKLYQDMENAVFTPDGINPDTGKHFTEYIDIDSFARHFIIDEVTKQMDVAAGSQYLFKPEDSVSTKLFAGPNWDFDRSLGIPDVTPDNYHMSDPELLYAAMPRNVDYLADDSLWHGLYSHEEFSAYVARLYMKEGYEIACRTAEEFMPETAKMIEQTVAMDGVRWGKIDIRTLYENRAAALAPFYENANNASVFLRQRTEFLTWVWRDL